MKILIVDDHALVRRGMGHVVRESFSDAEVVEASSAAEAMEAMATAGADIALVDVRMPDLDGLELLHDMRERWPLIGWLSKFRKAAFRCLKAGQPQFRAGLSQFPCGRSTAKREGGIRT